jgi:hypothetical protein
VPETPLRRVTALSMTYTHGVPRRTPTQGPQRRGLNYLSRRAAECVRRSLAATVQDVGQEGVC